MTKFTISLPFLLLYHGTVKGIGQGFAAEIFRVFKSMHPAIKIDVINVSPSVGFMIKRAS